MQDEVLEFIRKRFPDDFNWTNGNCYYFAIILKTRFPEGKIYYDIINGHFVFMYNNLYYDYVGSYYEYQDILISWDEFDEYDSLLKQRIVRDCIM